MFGSRLTAARKRLNLKQDDVASFIGTSRSVIGMIETDRTSLGAERLLKLGELGFDVIEVLTGEPGVTHAGRLLDWDLLVQIAARIDEFERTSGTSFQAEKKALLWKYLYLRFATQAQIDDATFHDILRMAT